MIEEARKHIEEQIENIDSPVGQVGAICLAWLEYAPETAAPLLMAEGKTLGGALEAMREYARQYRARHKDDPAYKAKKKIYNDTYRGKLKKAA
jgi:hypothetical protein